MNRQSKYATRQRIRPTLAPLTAAVSLALGASTLQAATIPVSTLDDGSVAGECTLRDAFEAANADASVAGCPAGSGADDIVFESGLSGTLTLTDDAMVAYSEISVAGPGSDQVSIDGDGAFQLFAASGNDAALSISGLTLTDGYTSGGYGGAAAVAVFGASLSMSDCVVSGNTAIAPAIGGGGVSAIYADLTIANCSFEGNSAGAAVRGGGGGDSGLGGAVVSYASAAVDISNSSFDNNDASYAGGAIAVISGDGVDLSSLDASGNEAYFGAGIALMGDSNGTLAASTVTDGDSAAGGGVLVTSGSALDISDSNIDGNFAYYDGGGVLTGVGYGGVIYAAGSEWRGGGDLLYGVGDVDLTDATLDGNTAYRFGGGMAVKYGGSYALTVDSTLSGNFAGPVPVGAASGPDTGGRFERPAGGGYEYGGGGVAVLYGGEAYVTGGSELSTNAAIQGGGMLVVEGYGGVIDSLVHDNYAAYGGGVQSGLLGAVTTGASRGGGASSLAFVVDSTISGNEGATAGGGAFATNGAVLSTYNTLLELNQAGIGGGLVNYNGYSGVKYSEVADNTAYNYGGGIAALGPDCDLLVENTLITGNSADLGGGVYTGSCTAYVGYSTVSNNQASYAVGGAAFVAGSTPPEVLNTTVTANTGPEIGGIYATAVTADFITVSHNTATTAPARGGNRFRGSPYVGGALLVAGDGDVTVGNSIFSDNDDPDGPGDLTIVGTEGQTLDYSLVEEPVGTLPAGTGNLVGAGYDPQLGSLADNGGPTPTRALPASSPAVDAANPVTSIEFDQRGQPFRRAFNGRADMGAFERVLDGVFSDRFEQP